MSCSLCYYITGHDPSCRHYHEDAAADLAALEARVSLLERSIVDLRSAAIERDQLTARVVRLRALLIQVGGFLRDAARRPELGRGAIDLIEEADDIEHALKREFP